MCIRAMATRFQTGCCGVRMARGISGGVRPARNNRVASNMDLMTETFLGVPFFFWGIVCLVVAGVFAVAWPRNNVVLANRTRYLILRWGHSLVWVFLALS